MTIIWIEGGGWIKGGFGVRAKQTGRNCIFHSIQIAVTNIRKLINKQSIRLKSIQTIDTIVVVVVVLFN